MDALSISEQAWLRVETFGLQTGECIIDLLYFDLLIADCLLVAGDGFEGCSLTVEQNPFGFVLFLLSYGCSREVVIEHVVALAAVICDSLAGFRRNLSGIDGGEPSVGVL